MLLMKKLEQDIIQQSSRLDMIYNDITAIKLILNSSSEFAMMEGNIETTVQKIECELSDVIKNVNLLKQEISSGQEIQNLLQVEMHSLHSDLKGIGDKLWRNDWEPNQNIRRRIFEYAGMDTAQYVIEHMRKVRSFNKPLDILPYAINQVTIAGLYLEFGVYLGTTINKIASIVPGQTVYGFDSFNGLPETWRTDFEQGLFKLDTLPVVGDNVVLIKGLFDETLPDFSKNHNLPCAFIHIDCDLYSSTKTVLQQLEKQIVSGTIIVFDEYFNYPGWRYEEYRAFQEFISEKDLQYEYLAYVEVLEQVAVKIL